VDSERALKIELRQALDEVLPAAPWLEAAVRDDLRKRRSRSAVNKGRGTSRLVQTVWPRTPMQVAAGVFIVLLAAAAVAAFLGLRSHATQTEPAGPLSIAAYQTMVGEDSNLAASSGDITSCTSLQSICPAPRSSTCSCVSTWARRSRI
jgi:hypothetical protein